MVVFKCKMCGGDVSYSQGSTVGTCENCGTQQTLPRIYDDRRANLYDRAGHLRRNNEYDKAMSLYEQLLNEDMTDAEAYWSLVLCKYGVEYVEDPVTRKRVPTVNRTQYTSVYSDENYKMAVTYADSVQRNIYESDAAAIDSIQKGILEISSKEEPYDVFLCYKETDSQGRRTIDSVLAYDIYTQLVREGYKVFYSRITLENVLGTAYEPHIFAALNSAKVMVVVGTRAEYFNSPWVKNEWSRYLALISQYHEKILIPAYRDMDPYDMPQEFSHLQALDMGRIGFLQDLLGVIQKKVVKKADSQINRETTHPTSFGFLSKHNESSVVPETVSNVNNLLKRAEIFLEDGDFSKADHYYNRVLFEDINNVEALYGKLLVSAQVKTSNDLVNCDIELSQNQWYKKIIELGSPAMVAALTQCKEEIDQRIENKKKDAVVRTLIDEIKKALCVVEKGGSQLQEQTAISWAQQARDNLEKFKDYKSVEILMAICDRAIVLLQERRSEYVYDNAKRFMDSKTVEGYKRASELFHSIIDWKDSRQLKTICDTEAIELPHRLRKEMLRRWSIAAIVLAIVTSVLTLTFNGNKARFLKFMLVFDGSFFAMKYVEMRMKQMMKTNHSYESLSTLRTFLKAWTISVGAILFLAVLASAGVI